jgi:hypothetical protein
VSKKPKFITKANPVLNENAFYLLPKKLLDKCTAVLPAKNTEATAIVVGSQSQPSEGAPQVTSGRATEGIDKNWMRTDKTWTLNVSPSLTLARSRGRKSRQWCT